MITEREFNETVALEAMGGIAAGFARKSALILAAGGSLGAEVVKAFDRAEAAGAEIAAALAALAPLDTPQPKDGTAFWATNGEPDGDVKLVRYGVLPDRPTWGTVLHTVDGQVWLSAEYYRLWWPLDVFPIPPGATGKQPRTKSK